MDVKTYEYMKDRTRKFESLKDEVKLLNSITNEIKDGHSASTICIRGDYYEIPEKSRPEFNGAIMTAITNRVVEIRKEMEEI